MDNVVMPARGPGALWRETDGSIVVFLEHTGQAYVLDAVASSVWLRIDGHTSLEDVATSLQLEKDSLSGILAQFSALGFLAEDGSWGEVPSERCLEEIVFAACDCSSGGRGVQRNANCVNVPQQQTSTI